MSSAYDVGLTAHACRRRALPRGSVRLRGRAPDADGNGAFDQRQNDVFGAVLDSILLHLPRSRPAAASAMADRPVTGPVRYGGVARTVRRSSTQLSGAHHLPGVQCLGVDVGPCCSVCVGQSADDVGVGLVMMGASDVRRVTVLGHGARLLATRGAGRHLGRPQTGGRTGPNTSLALPETPLQDRPRGAPRPVRERPDCRNRAAPRAGCVGGARAGLSERCGLRRPRGHRGATASAQSLTDDHVDSRRQCAWIRPCATRRRRAHASPPRRSRPATPVPSCHAGRMQSA